MPDITNPTFILFTNEKLRKIAETVRDLKIIVDDAAEMWVDEIAPLVSTNVASDKILDGREAQGVSRLVLGDLIALIGVVGDMKTTLDGAGVMDIVRKPTVRTLEVGG